MLFRSLYFSTALVITSQLTAEVSAHGRLLEPPNRSSLFRCNEFSHLEPPENWDDNALYCGGKLHQHDVNGGKCGVCGDPYDHPIPRANEDGGELYRGIIVRAYRSGDVIPIEVELTTSHKGYFQFRLCAKDDADSHRDQNCFDEHLLELADGSGTNYKIPIEGGYYYADYNLTLPKDVTCEHCVLQWHYEAGNDWNNCTDGNGALGCGRQENFRGCSDITIYPKDTQAVDRNPSSRFKPGEDEFGGVIPITYHNGKRRCNRTTGSWEMAGSTTEAAIIDTDLQFSGNHL
ncbi:unnamed protein product [Orchesella dallaii]|uniref:Chitin-binding type-4 domain-containing protein n=1 Tax=Orchesella dallaii TaxID=48710 RepID=A0ABP1Q541_9HEXA